MLTIGAVCLTATLWCLGCCLGWKKEHTGHCEGQYHSSTDGTAKDEQQIIADTNKLAAVVGLRIGVKPEFVDVRGDGDRAWFRLAMQPWAHVKTGKLGGTKK